MYNFIDLFAGCGGLSEGFHKAQNYRSVAAVEWEKQPVDNLIHRLETKWGDPNASEKVLQFDIQRIHELFNGWHDDPKYGSHQGLDSLVASKSIDLIIGGPPCQAYSLAGRVQDKDGMKNDYRNYLFESYIKVVDQYKPKIFVFENVVGLLSAKPRDTLVVDLIREEFDKHGYAIISDLKEHALLDLSTFGVPQKRKRVIIIGVRKDLCSEPEALLEHFYTRILPKYQEPVRTVEHAISDLPKLYPTDDYRIDGKKFSHTQPDISVNNHQPRYHNSKDIETFGFLADDIQSGRKEYISTDSLRQLYTEKTGKNSSVHKYYVLRRDEPSNTIPAHLYKDGLRHIHPDPQQARSITVREAARLQTFDDDYEFITAAGLNYKMIGNAVPPLFAYKLAKALTELLEELDKDISKELDNEIDNEVDRELDGQSEYS